jgi:hypothetical protein
VKQVVKPGDVPDAWSAEALYAKALRYAEKMNAAPTDSWEHALWSGLSLELLARAALANLSPTLLADHQKWSNLAHALGFPSFEAKFSPTSIGTAAVLLRLRTLLPDFDTELENFCVAHTGRRNEELHSGSLPYDGVPASRWHGSYYRAATVLLASMGHSLADFIGGELAEIAAKEIEAANDAAAKSVIGDVEAHRKVWESKGPEERAKLAVKAEIWASREQGHRVACPACGNPALVVGEPIGEPVRTLDGDEVTERQEHLPQILQCVACGLKITGLSRLLAVGLADRYAKTQTYDASEYYAAGDPYDGYEDDNNEPF